MKVFAVTTGEYSAYCVEGIYSTLENAEKAHRMFASENRIVEYEVDAIPDHPPGMLYYLVEMDVNGNTDRVKQCNVCEFHGWNGIPTPSGRYVGFDVWAKDETHAVKIANEKRIQLIASGEFTTDWKNYKSQLKEGVLNAKEM